MRGGVNEGWPGWARGSNPVRARGFRNGGKHLGPSGSAPLRGGAKEGDLGRIVQSGGSLQTRCKVERRHRCSSTFEEGSSRIACSPSSRGDSAHAMSLPSKGGYCGRKPAVSSRGSLAIDPGNRSKVANAWRHRCAMPTGTGSGAKDARFRARSDARGCARASYRIAEVVGRCPGQRSVFSASRKGRRGRERGLARRENLPNGGRKLRAKRRREADRGGKAAAPGNCSV
jgi:hypothetical protein